MMRAHMSQQQRQFERYEVSEETVATDKDGRVLGKVVVAGGGGMGIRLEDHIQAGDHLRVTIVEPTRGIEHTIDVVVRYVHDGTAGVEFVTGQA
jgi:hypothetical protein